MVDFPDPVEPTMALNLFFKNDNEIFYNIFFSGFKG
jgi:hypothetical protein